LPSWQVGGFRLRNFLSASPHEYMRSSGRSQDGASHLTRHRPALGRAEAPASLGSLIAWNADAAGAAMPLSRKMGLLRTSATLSVAIAGRTGPKDPRTPRKSVSPWTRRGTGAREPLYVGAEACRHGRRAGLSPLQRARVSGMSYLGALVPGQLVDECRAGWTVPRGARRYREDR
jgi:hypothetical protein